VSCFDLPQKIYENIGRGINVDDDAADAKPDALRLDHFLKLTAISGTGGQAKLMIQNGEVKVNGEIETRRRRKLNVDDVVEVDGKQFRVKESLAGE
jgi:ribosome-associated protein